MTKPNLYKMYQELTAQKKYKCKCSWCAIYRPVYFALGQELSSNLQCITKRKRRLRFNSGFEIIIWMRGEKMVQFIFFSLWFINKIIVFASSYWNKIVQNWTFLIDIKTAKSRLIRIHQFWFFKFYFLFIIMTFTMIDVTAQMFSHCRSTIFCPLKTIFKVSIGLGFFNKKSNWLGSMRHLFVPEIYS